jgi:glycosyltransferase involved in cell wall biosynthesis
MRSFSRILMIPSTQEQSDTGPIVSVIVPVLDEEKVIGRCLQSLSDAEFPANQFEVIVVDNGSIDNTIQIVESFRNVLRLTILRHPRIHISAVRNCGAAQAKGQLLAFLDADCLVPANWFRTATEILLASSDVIAGAY